MDERELAAGLALRDSEAFSVLLRDYVPKMLRYATRLHRNFHTPEPEVAAEDTVQELLGKWATNHPPKIGGPVATFVLRSVYNSVVDADRLRKRQLGLHPRAPGGIAAPDRRYRGALVEKQADETDEEFDEVCVEAYATLSATDREVLEMNTRNMATKEKATEMQKSPSAFYKHVHDARGRLVRAVEDARARRAKAE